MQISRYASEFRFGKGLLVLLKGKRWDSVAEHLIQVAILIHLMFQLGPEPI